MTPEAQRIAIAEACGWTEEHKGLWIQKLNTYAALPDYYNDLNAMHEAEKVLKDNALHAYEIQLLIQIQKCKVMEYSKLGCDFIWHATAAQRAEAFLRTLSLWKD